jgi:hypothetical protein
MTDENVRAWKGAGRNDRHGTKRNEGQKESKKDRKREIDRE